MGLFLVLLFVLLLLAALPTWPYSRAWGYGPSAVLATAVALLLLLILLERI